MNTVQSGRIVRVRTDKDLQFAAAIAQNVGIQATLVPGANGIPKGLATRFRARLRSIKILSKENLAWEVWLFGSSAFATTDADTEKWLGRWTFVAADGIRATVGGVLDTHYHYYIDGLDMPLQDADGLGQLYLRLVNRSVAAKSAGANGELIVELGIEPTQGNT